MLIDTHTHLYLEEFQPSPEDAVQRAFDAGVGHLVFPNVDLSTIEPMLVLHEKFPIQTSVAMGLHPTEIHEGWQNDLDKIKAVFDKGGYVAVGEVGIDLYWEKTFGKEQAEAFDAQLGWAFDTDLPVIIHCREGLDTILDVFEGRKGHLPQCVFHSFGGTIEDVAHIRRYGDHYFGINGIVTFKNSRLREVPPAIGIDRILLETDSPYLAPVPHRGHRNESAFLIHTAAHVAQSLGIEIAEVECITTASARRFFGIET